MPHSPFDKPRTVMIAGVKYVCTIVSVTETHDDGEPRVVVIPRVGDDAVREGFALVYLPASWSRGVDHA